MPSLDDDFDELICRLRQPATLAAARSDPFFYFVYLPEQALEVKRQIPRWSAKLRNAGVSVERVSFSDLLWQLIDASGRWEQWLAVEADFDREQSNDAIQSVLSERSALIGRVAAIVEQPRPNTVVFLTETEMLHPYFRVRIIENALHDRVKVPVVVFYPGRRSGQYGLHFLDLYEFDGNYRATLIGGLR